MTLQQMEYRRLGRTGLKLSVLSFGSWVTFDNQLKDDVALECMQAAHDAGCNFFDNAEVYAGGESEAIMGRVLGRARLAALVVRAHRRRSSGASTTPCNMRNTLNRKYLLQAIDGSLERLGQDFVDVLYCHRPDPDTTLEETVWAMSDIVSSGKALYWGTSEWAADEIRGAIEIAERHHLHKPVTEQPQYNLLERRRVEQEYARLFDEFGYGATIWSPLASGLLTGKYRDGDPRGLAWRARRLRLAGQAAVRRAGDPAGRGAAADRRRARAARWPSWPWPGARRTRTCRRSSPAPASRSRWSRTSPPSSVIPLARRRGDGPHRRSRRVLASVDSGADRLGRGPIRSTASQQAGDVLVGST